MKARLPATRDTDAEGLKAEGQPQRSVKEDAMGGESCQAGESRVQGRDDVFTCFCLLSVEAGRACGGGMEGRAFLNSLFPGDGVTREEFICM